MGLRRGLFFTLDASFTATCSAMTGWLAIANSHFFSYFGHGLISFPRFFFSFLPLSFLGFGLLNVRKGLDLLSTNYMQDAIHKSWIGYPRLSLSNINKCDLIWALVESRKEHTRKTNFRFLSCLTKHYSTQFRWTFGRGCSSDWFLQPAESLDRGPFALCLADKQAPWWHLSPRSLDTHGRVWSKLSGSTRYVKLRTCIFQA